MVAPSKRIVVALTLACALSAMLAAVRPAPAAAGDGQGTQTGAAASCIVGHRFEPGPIVGGHNRQPTQAEFEARKRELLARSQGGGGRCSVIDSGGTSQNRNAPVFGLKTVANF